MTKTKGSVEFGTCIWEDSPIRIDLNYSLDSYDEACSHVEVGRLKAVVVGTNEGGYNTTGICLECILDWTKENKPELLREN